MEDLQFLFFGGVFCSLSRHQRDRTGSTPRSGSTGRATLWSRIASPCGAQSTADASSRRGQALSGVPSKQGWTHAPTRGRSSGSRCSAQTLIHIRLHTVIPAAVSGNGVQPIQPGLDESEEKKPQRKKKNQVKFAQWDSLWKRLYCVQIQLI